MSQGDTPALDTDAERSLSGSIAVLRPNLVAELHPTRNGDLDPLTVSRRSSRKLLVAMPPLRSRVARDRQPPSPPGSELPLLRPRERWT